MGHRVVTPIDMNKYHDDDDEDEENDEYYADDGRRNRQQYDKQYVDENEQYIIDRNIRKKMQKDLKNGQDSYAEHIFDHQQHDTATMDDIVRQMDLSANGNHQSNTTDTNYYDEYDYYHQ